MLLADLLAFWSLRFDYLIEYAGCGCDKTLGKSKGDSQQLLSVILAVDQL